MRDEGEDLRRVGRDEMNLAEYPITLLTERVPPGCKTMVFEDQHGQLTVSGSDAYGLPTTTDSDVIVGLIQLTKLRNDFTDPTVEFSRYELLKLLGWENKGRNYRRLSESLHRWVGVTLKYDGCWWDNKRKRRVSASFHVLDRLVVPDEDDSRVVSSFTWGKDFFDSCRAGNLKRLDLEAYFALKSAVSKQLYRFLDKRFYLRREWDFDLRELAHERVGMSRNYAPWKIKQELQPALEELEAIGFLEPMTAADRYSKAGRGAWNIRIVRKLPAPTETKSKPKPGPTGLERELVERGVTRGVAAELVRDLPRGRGSGADRTNGLAPGDEAEAGRGRRRLPRRGDPEGLRAPGRFPEPGGAGQGGGDRAGAAGTGGAGPSGEGPRAGGAGPDPGVLEGLAPGAAGALEAEALAGADPADRAAYEAATATPVKKMLLTALREALIRQRLGLPVVS